MSAQTDPRVQPHVRAAAKQVEATFGISDIGGFATTGHISNSDHYRGLAIDVMTSLKGQQVADWATANAKQLCITYVIWNRHIWDIRDGKGWVPYNGTSPHTDHVHISFYPSCNTAWTPDQLQGAGGTDVGNPSTSAMGCTKLFASIFGA